MSKPPLRLTQISAGQSKYNARRKLDEELAYLEKRLAEPEHKEDEYITKLREEFRGMNGQPERMNLGQMKAETEKPKISQSQIIKNQAKIQTLQDEYDFLSKRLNELNKAEAELNKDIEFVNRAINNQIHHRNPDPKNNLETNIQRIKGRIGDNFVGLGADIRNKNFTDTNQVKETLNTVSGRTSPLGKADAYKQNVKRLSHEMDQLNDQKIVKNLTKRSASDLLETRQLVRDYRDQVIKEKIAVKRDMGNIEIDIKYLEPKQQQRKQPDKGGDKLPKIQLR